MRFRIHAFIAATLLAGVAALIPTASWAGSCCGGGSATSLIVPKYASAVADVSADLETYNGFWNRDGAYTHDPPGSDLKQYRLNLGLAKRLSRNWQASILVPYVWNRNRYSGLSSESDGIGDMTVGLWYEALEDKSAWKIRTPEDLMPAITIGTSLLIPTGISPFDEPGSSFDVTGRGFYRVDGNLLIDKTIQPWSISVALSYGKHIERPVNREYGRYIEPYHKQLGDRASASVSLSYNYYLGSGGDILTGTVSYSYLNEDDASINGVTDSGSGFRKQTVGMAAAFSGTDRDWSVRAGWNHAIARDGWGKNFPITDIFTVGVRYVFR